jgi:hypothetical protein
MTIKEIFEFMRECGLTNSQVEFSKLWLGRSDRYYSHLVALGREPGIATLCGIVWRLERLLENEPCSNSLALSNLTRAIANRIERRSISDRRKLRQQVPLAKKAT